MSKYALLRHASRLTGMKILAAMLLVAGNAGWATGIAAYLWPGPLSTSDDGGKHGLVDCGFE